MRRNKRGRKLAPVLWILVCLAMFAWTASASTSGPSTSETSTYTVQPGDTVWSIAQSLNPNGQYDTRDIREEIDSLNHLDGQVYLSPGTRLSLPAGR